MRVLVVGGAGYIGSHTAKALAVGGHDPIVLDELRHGTASMVRWGPLVEGSTADLTTLDRVFAEHHPEAVIHFAADAYVGESMAAPAQYFRNNVVNTLNLLDKVLEPGPIPFVFSSTCAVYGEPQVVPITEDTAKQPVNPYGESKLFVEKALRWYGKLCELPWMALRYFNAAGADPDGELGEQHDPEPHLVPRAIGAAVGEYEPLEIFGTDYPTPDGTAVRDYIHVADLARAHVAAIEHLGGGGRSEAVNLGTGQGHSVREVIAAVEAAVGSPVPHAEGPRRRGDPPELVADPSLARELLHWKATHSDLETIAATAARWHQENWRNRQL